MKKIILVDDDPDIRESLKMVLENAGYDFKSAVDASSGMNLIMSGKPDLVILDVMMEQPDDGIFMAQELRAKGIAVPIIMLTSISSVTGMKYEKNDEMIRVEEFVEKPVSPAVLLAKIKAVIESGRK